jgi:hypothetical protein
LCQQTRVWLAQLQVSKFIEVVRDAILFLLWVLFCLLPYSLGVYVLFLLASLCTWSLSCYRGISPLTYFLFLSSCFILILAASGFGDEYKNFPLFFDVFKKVGLQTPYEQYTFYGSIGIFILGAYSPIQKAHFLNKWLHETDPSLKDIWAARANLSSAEQKGGQRYLEELKKVSRRYAVLPVSFLLFESIRFGYRKMSSAFSAGKN